MQAETFADQTRHPPSGFLRILCAFGRRKKFMTRHGGNFSLMYTHTNEFGGTLQVGGEERNGILRHAISCALVPRPCADEKKAQEDLPCSGWQCEKGDLRVESCVGFEEQMRCGKENIIHRRSWEEVSQTVPMPPRKLRRLRVGSTRNPAPFGGKEVRPGPHTRTVAEDWGGADR